MQGRPVPLISGMVQRLDRFWFTEARASSLAMLRCLIGGYALVYLCMRYTMLVNIAGSDAPMYEPTGLATLFSTPLPQFLFECVLILTMIANLAFVLGWAFRLSGPLFGLLLLFVLCYRNSWSMIYHMENLLVLQVLILGFTRAADAWSVDALLRWTREKRRLRPPAEDIVNSPSGHWQYGWPIRLLCTTTAVTYFLAGVAKICGPLGWSWATGVELRRQVAVDALRKELLAGGTTPWVLDFDGSLWLFAVMGVGALALELLAPFAIFGSRTPRLWAIVAIAFHWGVFMVMGIRFRYQLSGIAFAPFFLSPHARRSQPDPLLDSKTRVSEDCFPAKSTAPPSDESRLTVEEAMPIGAGRMVPQRFGDSGENTRHRSECREKRAAASEKT